MEAASRGLFRMERPMPLDQISARSAASIRRRRATLERQEAKVSTGIQLLQIECQHHTPSYKYRGDSGNYDQSADSYWIEWKCADCSKCWTTSQDYHEVRRYPNAVQVKS